MKHIFTNSVGNGLHFNSALKELYKQYYMHYARNKLIQHIKSNLSLSIQWICGYLEFVERATLNFKLSFKNIFQICFSYGSLAFLPPLAKLCCSDCTH